MTKPTTTTPGAHVLVVEDHEPTLRVLTQLLADKGYRAQPARDGAAALAALEHGNPDVVLLDLHLPDIDGMQILSAARALGTDARFILMTGHGSIDTAVEAMKLGAIDYLTKPLHTEELLLVLERTVREKELRQEVARLRGERGQGVRARIIGRAPALERMLELVARVAPMRATVLIVGETGTGKELVARAIHDLSDRANRPFVPINCSALPETLLESELFGHVRGSFTGAVGTRRGLIEEAHGGTLFLDEVSTLSPAIQVKLLRVLQERTIFRVGGNQPIPVDFRLVAATNVDLAAEVRAGRFREDLFYRLDVFPIRVPPLRERRSDVPLLAEYFRRRFAAENGIEPPAISPETMSRLREYDWPGNVRELENFIERAMITYSGEATIRFDPPAGENREATRALLAEARRERWNLARLEREYILDVLQEVHGHRGRAAELLGIDRRTLYRKLKSYRMQPARLELVG
ncbi:MAG: sigma-54-dependent Fis family transcriptional regulator [Gemmatimonadetes bacterium]|nr:sigma-54-dependent Fis family transcriptional regulator [Gemmatimonadota bacterium]